MKLVALLAVVALALCMVVFASEKIAALDGTSWKVDVEPDTMAKTKGEKQYKEVLTFADGSVSLAEAQKVGFPSSAYEVTKSGEKDWAFKMNQDSATTGKSVWTGTIHEKNIEGKMIMTKNGGDVLTYTFKGSKLD